MLKLAFNPPGALRQCNGLRVPVLARRTRCSAEPTEAPNTEDKASTSTSTPTKTLDKEINKGVKDIASTFAPRASGATGKNPAVPGSTLYNIFTYQAWICAAAGGLLSYNVIFPSDQPDIWRLMGMWSLWMFTVPSLRARQSTDVEKEWLNFAFLAIPIINVALPFVWKNFAFVYTADCISLAAIYYWKVYLPTQPAEIET